MMKQKIARALYKGLLTLYPGPFRERLAESMEQTFNDLCTEKQRTGQGLLRFVIRTFAGTTIGIIREHVLLIQEASMKAFLTNALSSAWVSVLLLIPFLMMEIINRRNFNEDFPIMLFFGLWTNLFVIGLILLPMVQARRTAKQNVLSPTSSRGNTPATNHSSALMISMGLILLLVLLSVLNSADWEPLKQLFNSPDAEPLLVFGIGVPGQFIALMLFSIPIAAGIIAAAPIVRTLRAGGSLFTHPANLIVVVLILSTFVIGLASLIIDQWPCFMGLPNCD